MSSYQRANITYQLLTQPRSPLDVQCQLHVVHEALVHAARVIKHFRTRTINLNLLEKIIHIWWVFRQAVLGYQRVFWYI